MNVKRGCLLVLVIVLTLFKVGSAKEFTLPNVLIKAQINPDGSMVVSEERTYRFSGDFGWASLWLPTVRPQTIGSINVGEGSTRYVQDDSELPGTFQVESTPLRTDIRWFYRAEDEDRTFVISYVVHNAIKAYQDVAELYWQFIGPGWDVPTRHAEVLVTLPQVASPGEVRVWGHGPIQGSVRIIDEKTALWEINGLPSKTFLEARMTFPVEFVPTATQRVETAGLPTILAEEKEWTDEANLTRARSKRDVRGILFIIPLTILGGIWFWQKVGRPYPGNFDGDYYREPPRDYEPAVLGILWRGTGSTLDIAATMLDLLRRKIIDVEPLADPKGRKRKVDFIIKRNPQADTLECTPNELLLIDLLFNMVENWLPTGEPVTLNAITRYARRHTTRFSNWHTRWTKAATQATTPYIAMDSANRGGRIIGGIVVVGLIALGITLMVTLDYVFTGLAILASAFVLLVLVGVSGRRTAEAQTEYNQWRAFRRFLKDFSNLKEAPVYSIAIWEHYLVYATVLGVAEEVSRQLEALAPQFTNDPYYNSSWLFMGVHNPGIASQSFGSALSGTFVSSLQSAMSQASSSSGGGGGFSSGGGGGGGGGGGSAG